MMKPIKILIASLALGLSGVVMTAPASAGDAQIDAAIDAGKVGERIDGYLGVVGNADAALTRKVSEVNNKRRAVYSQLANDQGTSVAIVAKLTGEKQIAKLTSGEFYMDESGSWKRK